MSAFVENTELIPVVADGDDVNDPQANVIKLKPELNFREEMLLQDELARIQMTNSGVVDVRFMIGTYQLALARAYIGDWSGPDFQDAKGAKVPCTPTNINRLSPHKPYVQAASRRITEIVKAARESPNPKSPAGTISTALTVPSSTGVEPSA